MKTLTPATLVVKRGPMGCVVFDGGIPSDIEQGLQGPAFPVEVFNVLNDENPYRFIGNRTASNFGQPTVFAGDPLQGEQRLIQLGLRLRY